MELDYVTLGKRVQEKRKQNGYSQKRVADITGLSLPHISNIENGNTKVSLLSLILIANALETGLDALLCDSLSSVRDPYIDTLIERSKTYTPDELRLATAVLDTLIANYRAEKAKLQQ